jgi:hypothetical protein
VVGRARAPSSYALRLSLTSTFTRALTYSPRPLFLTFPPL